jgi:adenylate kinase family enzyme
MESTVQIANVYIIGSTGSGKSTFANYLYNLSKEEKFKTGDGTSAVTQSVQTEEIHMRR